MTVALAEEIAKTINEESARGGWTTLCDPSLAFDTPQLLALAKMWRSKAEALGRCPSRSDFDARELKALLRNLAIVERVGADKPRYRFRYYGSEFVPLLGEQTGRYMDEFIPKEFLPRWIIGYEAVAKTGAPLRFVSNFQLPKINYLSGETFVAPFNNPRSQNQTFLVAMYVKPKETLQLAG